MWKVLLGSASVADPDIQSVQAQVPEKGQVWTESKVPEGRLGNMVAKVTRVMLVTRHLCTCVYP